MILFSSPKCLRPLVSVFVCVSYSCMLQMILVGGARAEFSTQFQPAPYCQSNIIIQQGE